MKRNAIRTAPIIYLLLTAIWFLQHGRKPVWRRGDPTPRVACNHPARVTGLMASLKFAPKCRPGKAHGLLFGCCRLRKPMAAGLHPARLTLWKRSISALAVAAAVTMALKTARMARFILAVNGRVTRARAAQPIWMILMPSILTRWNGIATKCVGWLTVRNMCAVQTHNGALMRHRAMPMRHLMSGFT